MTIRKMLFILGMAILLNQNILADTSKDGTKVTFTIINDSDFPAQFLGTDQGLPADPINHLNGPEGIFNFFPPASSSVLAEKEVGVLTVNLRPYLLSGINCSSLGKCKGYEKNGTTMTMKYGKLGSGKPWDPVDYAWCKIHFSFQDKDPKNPDGTGSGKIDSVEKRNPDYLVYCEQIDDYVVVIKNAIL